MSSFAASTKLASQRGVSLLPEQAKPSRPYYGTPSAAYTRPADWITIPTLTAGVDKKVYVLAAVYENDSNLFAVQCSTTTGTYTVDWGDGLGTQTYTSGTTASYNIAWANIGSGTLTSRGFRQALITITPTTGGAGLTAVRFDVKHTNDTSTSGNPHNILEVSICDSSCARITFGSAATIANIAYNPMLEQVNIIQTAAAITATGSTFDYMFGHCYNLQSVTGTITGPNSGTYSATGMFQDCQSLRRAPTMDLPYCTYAVNMFQNCYALQEVNLDNVSHLSSVANWGQAFQNCFGLINAPRFALNGSNCESWSSTFQSCSNLKNVPYIDASDSRVSFFNSMFNGCTSLQNAPVMKMPTSGNYSAASMFLNCQALKSVPQYDWSRCTTFTSTFENCYSLESIPNLNLTNATTLNLAFNNCYNVQSAGVLTVGASTTTLTSVYANCVSLRSFGGLVGATAVTNASSMFSVCRSLVRCPDLSLPACVNFSSMFLGATSLLTAPSITTNANVTSAVNMFTTCLNLTSIPDIPWNWGASANINGMFQTCRSLRSPPSFTGNTASITTWANMFNGCGSLITGGSWTTTGATNMAGMYVDCRSLTVAPTISSLASVTTVNQMFSGCHALAEIPAYNLNAVSSSTNFTSWANGFNISRIQVTNTRFTLSYAQLKLAAAQLDEIYTNLPTVTAQTITVTGNWGTATDTPSIATAKGWTVTGS